MNCDNNKRDKTNEVKFGLREVNYTTPPTHWWWCDRPGRNLFCETGDRITEGSVDRLPPVGRRGPTVKTDLLHPELSPPPEKGMGLKRVRECSEFRRSRFRRDEPMTQSVPMNSFTRNFEDGYKRRDTLIVKVGYPSIRWGLDRIGLRGVMCILFFLGMVSKLVNLLWTVILMVLFVLRPGTLIFVISISSISKVRHDKLYPRWLVSTEKNGNFIWFTLIFWLMN